MTQGILNPVNLQPLLPLLPAEQEFARCLAGGLPCLFLKDVAPAVPEAGTPDNTVRAEVIDFFAQGGDAKNPILGSSIVLRGAWIIGGKSLHLMYADVPYALIFAHCHFAVPLRVPHTKCVALILDGTHLAHGLMADGLTTKGDVNLRNGFFAEGEVRLLGASIGGNFNCRGGKFRNPDGYALAADGLSTKGNVSLCEGFSAEGEVRMLGANIGGDLDCVSGKFHNPKGYALVADRLATKGDVNLREDFSAEGEVRMLDADVGGNFNCRGGKFRNPDGYALAADGLSTKGNVSLCEGFSAEGEVRMLGANIGGSLECEGGKFRNPNGYALNAERCNINGGLLWQEMSGGGIVDWGHAHAGILADKLDSWNLFKVVLDGFTYNQFAAPTDAESRIEWLGNRPDDTPFSPLPYEQAAKALFGMGHARDAREILLKKERLQTKDKRTPWHHKIGRRLWDALSGYGYRLRYTAAWMTFFIYTGTCVFLDADLQHRIVPHQQVVLAHPDYQSAAREGARPTEFVPDRFSGYPEFNQFWFSVDVFVPLFNLHQETHWSPARDERGGFSWVTLWYWIEIAAGWILTSLFLLSVTGVLRPRQSSGEKG